MKGMILKDLFMIKGNYKALLVALLVYIFYPIMFNIDMSYFLPFMAFIVCISTFSYDDFNNFYMYSSSLPYGRESVVKSKYIVTIGMILLSSIIGIGFSFILCYFKEGLVFDISTFAGIICGLIFMACILFPILFKYGAEKGRIIMIVLGFLIYGVVFLLSRLVSIDVFSSVLSFIENYFWILFITLSSLFISVSYFISKNIFLKKEF